MEWIGDHLAVLMFLVLTVIMFVGYPVAFVLGGVAWRSAPSVSCSRCFGRPSSAA